MANPGEPHELDWYDRLPKIELHVHLEGAIPLPALLEIIEKHGDDHEVADLEALESRFAYRDFEGFIDVWTWKNGFLRDYEDFEHSAHAGEAAWRNKTA